MSYNIKTELVTQDCCCYEHQRRRRRRVRIRLPFTADELQQLVDAAEVWNRDTGRSCGDFFKTMRTPGNPDRVLADRPTLLAKTATLNAAENLFLATTICAKVKKPPPPHPAQVLFVNDPLDPRVGEGIPTGPVPWEVAQEERARVLRLRTVPPRLRFRIRDPQTFAIISEDLI